MANLPCGGPALEALDLTGEHRVSQTECRCEKTCGSRDIS